MRLKQYVLVKIQYTAETFQDYCLQSKMTPSFIWDEAWV